ncbi:ABC transporter substrate-binding protein [Cohnella sp. LGH]|uniref:ABC transporter substrate-binding protein n=1 Tax=Cohnella sp. LGH TaxID=1619153 RepID=UPI001FFE08E7|nr:ABC transporter substrate-binding protein [Cohnella sp. LGH]
MKKTGSKRWATSLLMLCSLLVTAACGSTTDNKPSPSGNAESPAATSSGEVKKEEKKDVALTFVASQNWVNKGSKVDSDLIEAFTKETGIKVDLQVVPDDQYANVLKTKMTSGEVPDIFMVGAGSGAYKYLPEKYFADLSNEEWVSRYAPYAKTGTTINDKISGFMTWNVDGWGILYNKELFAQHNVQVPKTMEELMQVADTLKTAGIETPLYMVGKEAWYWAIWFSQFGPKAAQANPGLYDKLNNQEMKFADVKEFETFLAEFKTLYDKGYFGKNSLSNAWDSSYEAMGTGKSAMILMYQSYQGEVAEKYADSKASEWEMFPIPLAGNDMYSHSAGGNMRVAYKDSKNLDSVKQFFDFMAKPENLNTFYEGRPDLQSNPSFTDVAGKPSQAGKTILENAPGGQGLDMEYGLLYWDNTIVGKYIQELMLGSKTPIQVLEAIDKDREKLFAAQNQ